MRNHDTGFPVRTNYEALIGHLSTPQYIIAFPQALFEQCVDVGKRQKKSRIERRRDIKSSRLRYQFLLHPLCYVPHIGKR
jgi:hypothetical protein